MNIVLFRTLNRCPQKNVNKQGKKIIINIKSMKNYE